jgi:Mrp family chromosome partitioning ATPase
MEKLQKALQKARTERGDTPATGTGTGTDVSSPLGSTALWAELRGWEPDPKSLERNRLVASTANATSAPFDILRTKILLTMRKNGWTRLGVTSATPNCGKSFVAANIALGCSRNPDMSAILIELDLREPDLAKMLKLPPTGELSAMLEGRRRFDQQALRYRDNVAIAAARQPTGDPTSVLLNRSTPEVLERIEAEYAPDLMIFDLPPVLTSDDTRAVLKDMDCALLVAKAGASTLPQVDNCEREIAEHTNVLGIVLNECRDLTDDNY